MRHVLHAICLVLAVAGAAADDILLTDGTRVEKVEVTSETLAEVKYTKGGAAQSIAPGTRVRSILRAGVPEGLDNGFGFLGAGQPQKAIDEFTAQLAVAGWVGEYAAFGLGQAKMALGQRGVDGSTAAFEGAIESFDKLIAANPQSRFLIEANLLKGVCYRLLKRYDQAIAAYDRARAAAAPIADGWPERAALGVGWTHLEAGRNAEAKTAFDAATGASIPEVKREALVGWAEAVAATGGADEIASKMESLKNGADSAMLGVVHSGLGLAKFTAKKYAEARLELVQTVAVYAADPSAHAQALYFAGQCYKALGEDDYLPIYAKELRERYPLSSWTLRMR